jgi:hypothetical protein
MKRALLIAVTTGMLAVTAFGQRTPVPQPQIPPGLPLGTYVPPNGGNVAANATDAATSGSDAPVGPRDQIEVKVFQDPTLNTRATVTDDGRITMP